MNANTLSKEAETRLQHFFNEKIAAEDMAKIIRQVNYLLSLNLMKENETFQNGKINLEENFFWLNELAEILNLYLNQE